MVGPANTFGYEDTVAAVASTVNARVQRLARSVGWNAAGGGFPGRLLRTRLAARLAVGRAPLERTALVNLCTATELLRLASLCHDDLLARPARPAAGQPGHAGKNPSAAVLMGDLLLLEATDLVVATRGGQHVKSFLDKAKQVLESDIQAETHGPGRPGDLPAREAHARGSTGPLFAFAAGICGTGQPALADALEEAGYQVGAAYRLADDAGPAARERPAALCAAALAGLAAWPQVQSALAKFIVHDLPSSPARLQYKAHEVVVTEPA